MPSHVVARVESLGLRDGQPSLMTFTDSRDNSDDGDLLTGVDQHQIDQIGINEEINEGDGDDNPIK